MKKIVCCVTLLAFAVASVFADWNKIVSVGFDVPVVGTTIEWDEWNGESETAHGLHGQGFCIDGQFRLVNDNSLSLLFDTDIGYIDIAGANGANFSVYFGVGKNFASTKDFKLILSGVLGIEADGISQELEETNISLDDDIAMTNIMFGLDFYLNKTLSKNLGFYAGFTAAVGAGGATEEAKGTVSWQKVSAKIDGDSEFFVFKPRFGVCWTF